MAEASVSCSGISLTDVFCCADLYQSSLAKMLLGDSWHPGGLALTRAMAKVMKLSRDDYLLDVACGRGASAITLAQIYKCRVTGMDRSGAALEQACKETRRYRLDNLVAFTEGDAVQMPFLPSSFTAALCECATTMFSNRQAALGEIARILQPGGRLALSDVTFLPERLPEPVDVPLTRVLCIPLRTGPDEYTRLIEGAGLKVTGKTDYSATLVELLNKAESLLGVGRLASLFGRVEKEQLHRIDAALKCLRQLVQKGDLGYWAFIAEKL